MQKLERGGGMVNENLLMYAKGFPKSIEPFSRANELMDVIMDFQIQNKYSRLCSNLFWNKLILLNQIQKNIKLIT